MWHDPTMGAKYGKLNRRSNNTDQHARKKRTMIALRENFGGTTTGRFPRQATVVKSNSRPRQRQVTNKACKVRHKRSTITTDLFPIKKKHLTPIGRVHR